MSTLKGIIRNGQVVVIGQTDLPEGTEVEILPMTLCALNDEGQLTPDEIARTLAAMEKIEPFEMTDVERAAIEADRQARKEWEKALFDEHGDQLRSIWEWRFLLDTGIAGDFINRRRGIYELARDEVARGNRVGIGIPVLAELAYGLEQSISRDINMQRLRTALSVWTVWPFDNKAAFEYGRLAAELKRIGRPMQQVDMMIAAIALSLGNCSVVTADSDLAAVPGLSVEDWPA